VAKANAKPAASAKRLHVHFYSLSPGRDEVRPKKSGDPIVWRDPSLGFVYTDWLAAGLAVGQHGTYAPDIQAIPTADNLVEVGVEWKHYREGDRVAVTLLAAPPHEHIRFGELPKLFLQVESNDSEPYREQPNLDLLDKKFENELLVTPLTIEARLPRDWRERVATDSARVAILVVAKSVEFPRGHREQLKDIQIDKVDPELKSTLWNGILCTEFTEMRFPRLRTQLPVR
jgi:hypothetical protein